MTSEAWLPWAIVGLCIFTGFLISLAMTVVGPATGGLGGLGRANNGSQDTEDLPQLDGGVWFFANALRVGSLLAGAAAFSVGLAGTPVAVYAIVAGSGASLGVGVAIGCAVLGDRQPIPGPPPTGHYPCRNYAEDRRLSVRSFADVIRNHRA